MKLLFYISNQSHYLTSIEIVEWFKKNKYAISIDFLVLDNYTNEKLTDQISKLGYNVLLTPRKSKTSKSIWNSYYEYEINFELVKSYFNKILKEFKFDLSVIVPYDRGLWEVLFIRVCNETNTKTLLLQEGLIITEDNKEPFLYDKPKEYFTVTHTQVSQIKHKIVFNTGLLKKVFCKFRDSIKGKDKLLSI